MKKFISLTPVAENALGLVTQDAPLTADRPPIAIAHANESNERAAFARIPSTGVHTEAARQARLAFIKAQTQSDLPHVQNTSFEARRLSNNIESFIGSIEVPVGIAGPLKINGRRADGVFYAPIATSEGALIASMSRGAYAISLAGGVTTRVLAQRMMRVPMFLFADLGRAVGFAAWINEHRAQITAEAEKHSHYAKLTELTPQVFGRAVHVHFVYETGDAAGQNMTTSCTWQACLWILKRLQHHPELEVNRFVVEGGLSSDKKVSFLSLTQGRGIKVQAEVRLPARIVRRVLKTTPHDIQEVWHQFAIGAAGAGIVGLNVNIANAVAGIFVATGQDIACVHESSLATTFFDVTSDGDLYICMSMPTLPIGTVGGGTRLPHQRECLEMLGCSGPGSAHRLAEIIVGFALALDLSTTAAIVAGHFATAHEMLGRNRDVNHLKLGELNEKFFQGHFRAALADDTLTVKDVIPIADFESGGSLITEMTSRKLKKTVGLFPFHVVYECGRGAASQAVMAKIKPTTPEVVGALNQLASMCGQELAAEFDKRKYDVGLAGTDRRELAVFRQTDERFTRHTPRVFGIYEDVERESFVLVQEFLADMELMDSANDVSRWTDVHLRAALSGIAECHAIWFEQDEALKACDWLGSYPTLQRRTQLMRLYGLLNAHATQEFPHWIGEKQSRRFLTILEDMPAWWAKIQAMPKTLIHNDFNPRNMAFRRTGDGPRLCVYDWELATLHIPQVDVVELLVYTLAGDVAPERVRALVDFHRARLEQQVGKALDPVPWREGFRYAAWEFFITRMSLYLMTHAFRNYEFIERVYASLWKILDIVEDDGWMRP
jgi:NADP-dependent 3-hydroxy-3-methylglutaryl-CoA reductase